jgi:two-component system, cell cycle response regulator
MPAQPDARRWTRGEYGAAVLANQLSEAVRGGKSETLKIAGSFGVSMLTSAGAGTDQHSKDVALITDAMGGKLGVTGAAAAALRAAAQLHDIAKSCITRAILEKTGPLDDAEWAVMRRHTIVGEQILSSVPELRQVARIVRHSHERWDGGGYPDSLAAERIPLASRIIFCAGAFHAIRVDRPYRSGRSAEEALAEINRCAGTQFDPRAAEALAEVVREGANGAGGPGHLF